MWANAQRDGCPAEYRWRPLFNAAKFGWRALLERRAVTLARHKTHYILQGCPKLRNRSQPFVGRRSPYYQNMPTGGIAVEQFFFRLSIHALVAKIQPDKLVRRCRDGNFLRPVFPASRVQYISDLHSKFALRPHHVSKYGRHPVSGRWDQARKKKKKQEKKYNVRICYAGRP